MSQQIEGYTFRRNRSSYLRAQDSLTYLDFIRSVEFIWRESHPDIPLYAAGLLTYPQYPCIIYGMESRMPMANEPKSKIRETIQTGSNEANHIQVWGQRFQNYVKFSVCTQSDTELAEAILETFEDFMAEFTPVFKKLGVSDLFYHNRPRDTGENRAGVDTIARSVIYLVVLEKVVTRDIQKLESVLIDVRRYLADATPGYVVVDGHATPYVRIVDQYGKSEDI